MPSVNFRMKLLSLFAALLFARAVHADCTPSPESWITLEVVAAEVAGTEPVEVIDIDRAGCAIVRYASFDTRAGLYRRQLSEAELVALTAELKRREILSFDATAVQRALETRKRSTGTGGEYFVVPGGDTYRLSIEDAAGAVRIEWVAPKQEAQRYRDMKALTDLVGLIETLQTLAANDSKTRIAKVTP